MENDFVAMATKICMATGKKYKSGEILINKRMRPIKEGREIIGWGFSPEVQEKINEGYIVLVEIDQEKSIENGKITPQSAYRLGRVCYLKREKFFEIFDYPQDKIQHMAFMDTETIDYLQNLADGAGKEE